MQRTNASSRDEVEPTRGEDSQPGSARGATPLAVAALALGAALGAVPLLVWPDALLEATELWRLADVPVTSLAFNQLVLLYLQVPTVLTALGVLLLSPGFVLAIGCGRAASVSSGLLYSIPWSLLLVILAVLVLGVFRVPPSAAVIWSAVLAPLFASAVIVALRARRRFLPWPSRLRVTLGWYLGAALLMTSILVPKLLWEGFNGDGVHAHETARLLLTQPLPFFPQDAGAFAEFPGLTSMLFAYPNALVLRIVGDLEVAARVPFVWYCLVLAAGIVTAGRVGGTEERPADAVRATMALAPYAMAMLFSATYSPYHADVAMPGVQDTLALICIVGFVDAIARRSWPWVAAFGWLSYLSLPSGLVLVAAWFLAELLVVRPLPRVQLARGAALLASFLIVATGVPALAVAAGQPPPGNEYNTTRMVGELLQIDLLGPVRLGYAALGAGIVPLFALLVWRRLDWVGRCLTVVVGLYLVMFLFRARFSLHHLAPVFVLPIIVLERLALSPRRRVQVRGAWVLGVVISLGLVVPRSFEADTTTRQVGSRILVDVHEPSPRPRPLLRGVETLYHLFGSDSDPEVPEHRYGGSPEAWIRYATSDASRTSPTYLITDTPISPGHPGRLVGRERGVMVFVLDEASWMRDRQLQPPRRTARLMTIPQRVQFGHDREGVIDLRAPVRALLRRLGVPVAE